MNDVHPEADIQEFFGYTIEEAFVINDINHRDLRRDVFNRIVTECTPELLREYYDTKEFLTTQFGGINSSFFKSCEDVATTEEQYHMTTIQGWANRGGTMLDYGCGAGQYGIFAAGKGLDVTLADINTSGFGFLSFLCKKYRPNIHQFVLDEDGGNLEGEFDYIFCTEVLEHTIDPLATLKNIINHMKIGGEIYLSTFFNDLGGLDPSHLKHNNIYQDCDLWFSRVAECGLKAFGYDPRGVLKIWKKVE